VKKDTLRYFTLHPVFDVVAWFIKIQNNINIEQEIGVRWYPSQQPITLPDLVEANPNPKEQRVP